jgi:membrane-bound metal-dependent hydrolase YbcI (DUF457 family)
MGRNHILGAVVVGIGVAAAVPHAPLLTRLLAVAVTGGAGLLPDLDHPSSKAARSLGPLTKAIATGIASLSLAIYHATRTELDPKDRASGHRAATHTLPAAVFFGAMTGAACLVHPLAGTVVLGLLVGLMALGFRSLGAGFTLAGGGVAWWCLTGSPAWWWLWPLCVTLGSAAHIGSDAMTNSGVPALWPLVRNGQRWGKVRTPVTFSTGQNIETHIVGPLLMVSVALAAGFAMGIPQMVIGAVTR